MLSGLIAATSGNCPPSVVGCPGYSYPQPVLLWVLVAASLVFLALTLAGWRRP